jgi:hypothetical protein
MTGYEHYSLEDLQDMYGEAKFMAFMCINARDMGNWHKWCKTCAELTTTIHNKKGQHDNNNS